MITEAACIERRAVCVWRKWRNAASGVTLAAPEMVGKSKAEEQMFGDVLIVDDERDICDLVAGVLEDEAMKRGLRKIATVPCGRLPVAVRQWCCLMCGCKAVVWTGLRF